MHHLPFGAYMLISHIITTYMLYQKKYVVGLTGAEHVFPLGEGERHQRPPWPGVYILFGVGELE